MVAEFAEPRFAGAGLLDRTPHQAAGLALARALATLPPGSDGLLPPAAWHGLCPDREAQDELLLPSKKTGAPSPFRYEPGRGLRFATAVDAAFVRTGMLDRLAYKGGQAHHHHHPVGGEAAGVQDVE